MNTQKLKATAAERRRFRVRKKIHGTPQNAAAERVPQSKHIYAQLIDDLTGVTLAAATSTGKEAGLKHGGNVKAAEAVGKKLAEAAKAKGITKAAFDRGHYRYPRPGQGPGRGRPRGRACSSEPKARPRAEAEPRSSDDANPRRGKDATPRSQINCRWPRREASRGNMARDRDA